MKQRFVNLRNSWRTAANVDLLHTSFSSHIRNLMASDSANDVIVHEKDILTIKFDLHQVQLPSYRLLTSLLPRHDERSENISIFHEPLTIRLLETIGNAGGWSFRSFRNWEDNINICQPLRGQSLGNCVRKPVAHGLFAFLHTDPIDGSIRSG